MARGFDTLKDIENAVGELRAKEDALGRELETANRERAEVMRERAGLVRQLAVARARSAVADGVIDEADRLDNDVAMILSARQRTLEGARARQREMVERQRELLAESAARHAETAALESELDHLAERARASLAGDASWEAAVARVAGLEAQRAKASEKAGQAKADRDRKGAPYENDPLFMYLWRRNYRAAGYAPGGSLIRWLDDWVAGLVRYNEARANYALLNEIPVRLGAHVQQLGTEAEAAVAERDEIETRRMREEAGHDIIERMRTQRETSKDVDARLAACETELSETSNLVNRYAQGVDDSFKLAVETLAAFLEHQRYDRLVAEARTTAEPTDDEIVARIGAESRKADGLDRSIETKRRELEALARRREELIRVAADFRRKSYHQPGSIFEPDTDLGPLLDAVVRGGIGAAEYWARTRQRQRWANRAGDPYRRDSGFPPFDFDIGWGGGGRGGDRNGPDFRTGGGF